MGVHLVTLFAKSSTCTPDIQRKKNWLDLLGHKTNEKNGDVTGSISKNWSTKCPWKPKMRFVVAELLSKRSHLVKVCGPPPIKTHRSWAQFSYVWIACIAARGFFGELKWWWSGGCTIPLKNVLIKLGLLEKMKIQNMWKWETTYANKWMILRFEHLVWK